MKKIIFFVIVFSSIFSSCSKDEDKSEEIITEQEYNGTGGLVTPSSMLDNSVPATPPPSSGGNLPASYDLSQFMPPVRNQGGKGSCASWATGYYLKSYQEHKNQNTIYGIGDNFTGTYSPEFLYNEVKLSNDCVKAGSYIKDNLERLKQIGICTWSDMPYNDLSCSTSPSSIAISNAKCAKIIKYFLLHSSNNNNYKLSANLLINYSKEFISRDIPIVIAIPLDKNFNDNKPLTNGEYIYKDYSSFNHIGYHAVLVVGYDDAKNAFKIVNSWGNIWGNKGYFWMDYALYGNIVYEAWTTTDDLLNCNNSSNSTITLSGSLDFGNVSIGSSATKTLTISNTGNQSFNVSSISLPNSAYTVNWNSGSIAANGSQSVIITFNPSSATSYNGTITVNNNATNSSNNTISVTGAGINSTSSSTIALSGSLAFGNVTIGSSATKTLTISNTGNQSFNVSSISLPNSAYTVNWNSGSIAANGSQSVIITFNPSSATSYNGTITVNNNATNGSNNTISVSGTGINSTSSSTIALSGSLAFGNVTIGSSATKTLTISNSGNQSFNVSSIWLPSNAYSVNWNSGSIAANGSQNVIITFKPTSVQSYNGTITVYNNATNGSNNIISVSGAGINNTSSIPITPSDSCTAPPIMQINTEYTVNVNIGNYTLGTPIQGHSQGGGTVRGFWLAVQIPSGYYATSIQVYNVSSNFDPVIGLKSNCLYDYYPNTTTNYANITGKGGNETFGTGLTGPDSQNDGIYHIRIYHYYGSETPTISFKIKIQ